MSFHAGHCSGSAWEAQGFNLYLFSIQYTETLYTFTCCLRNFPVKIPENPFSLNSTRCGINEKGDRAEYGHTTKIELKQRRECMLSITKYNVQIDKDDER